MQYSDFYLPWIPAACLLETLDCFLSTQKKKDTFNLTKASFHSRVTPNADIHDKTLKSGEDSDWNNLSKLSGFQPFRHFYLPGRNSFAETMLSSIPAEFPILKQPAFTPPTCDRLETQKGLHGNQETLVTTDLIKVAYANA